MQFLLIESNIKLNSQEDIRTSDALIESLKLKQKQQKLSSSESESERKQQAKTTFQRVELFSTDSELDSFFKENESLIKKSGYDSSRDFITNKIAVENDIDDLDFDKMVTDAQK